MNKVNRNIDLSGLPRKNGRIDWINSIGCIVPFKYDDIIGEVKITNRITKNNETIIYFLYENNEYHMRSDGFVKCKFRKILNKIDNFKFEIGQVFGEGKIISRKKEKDKKYNRNRRYYLMKCMNCGYERWVMEEYLSYQNYNCTMCGDGISYPEKVMRCILKMLNVEFITELNNKHFDWCDNYRYDFYLPKYHTILEVSGSQHFCNNINFRRSLEEEMINDENKQKIALKHVNKYIVIDCRYSNIDWIKNKILESELSEVFDLSKIDWSKVNGFAIKNKAKEVCGYYNKHTNLTLKEIAKHFNISISTVKKYVAQGKEIGWCENTKKRNTYEITVINASTNEVINDDPFIGSTETANNMKKLFDIKISSSSILNACKSGKPCKGFIFRKEVM